MRDRRGLVVAAVALVALGAVWVWRMTGELTTVGVGSSAPTFRAMTLDSTPEARTLADYRGDVVLLNIWATWCGPCRVEMPSIETLHRRFKDRGLKVVAVSIDSAGSESAVRDFIEEYGITFEVLHDPAGEIKRIYRATAVPETAVIARDGTIRKRRIGADDWSSPANSALIARLLAEAGAR